MLHETFDVLARKCDTSEELLALCRLEKSCYGLMYDESRKSF